MTINNENMKRVKHLFMTYRNGIVADSLRKAGMPYSIIFGLQLPQIKEIASELISSLSEEKCLALAEDLHLDRNVRESRILAMAIYPPERMTLENAKAWIADLLTREEAVLLPFLLLRRTPFIPVLTKNSLKTNNENLADYINEALLRFT